MLAVLAAFGLNCASAVSATAAPTSPQIGVQLYSVKDVIKTDFEGTLAKLAAMGFKGVEFLFPYAFEAGRIAEQLDKHRLQLVLHNLPAGNWEAAQAAAPDGLNLVRIASLKEALDALREIAAGRTP